MPVVVYQPGVAQVSTKTGGASDFGTVSWHLEGHWSLNQAAYAAIFTQVSTYYAAIASSYWTGPAGVDNKLDFSFNTLEGSFACDNNSLAVQAASIGAIVTNTGYLNGGN